jgi:hypothetical protein
MRDLMVLLAHLITTVLEVARPEGLRSVIVESLSSEHDPLYRFDQWQSNLRILDVDLRTSCW